MNYLSTLYVVATPIGNLSELSELARQTLSTTKLVICENTKYAKNLYQKMGWDHFGINFLSLHKFTDKKSFDNIIENLRKVSGVLISDAGYPGICDPGSFLVNKCRQEKIEIRIVNGPCAIIHALVGSGFEINDFLFIGFFKHTKNELINQMEKYKDLKTLIVGYLSVHFIDNNFDVLKEIFPSANVCVARELSKIHEAFLFGSFDELKSKVVHKGELVLIIDNTNSVKNLDYQELLNEVKFLTDNGMKLKIAVKYIAGKYNCSANYLYESVIKLKDKKFLNDN